MKKRVIKKIVVHCSASDDSLDIGVREIDGWHKLRGFLSPSGIHCGYHWVVRRSGKIEQGRPESEIGAHVAGHNSDSIGIVWVGIKQPTPEQYSALTAKVREVMDRYGVSIDRVYGHRELSPDLNHDGIIEPNEWLKTCPVIDCDRLRADILFTKAKP